MPGEPVEAGIAEQLEEPTGSSSSDETGEPAHDHRPEPPRGPRREGPVRVGVTQLMREEEDERDVQPAPAPDAGRERHEIDDRRPDAIATGTHRPNRRCSRIVTGAITTTTR